MRIVVAQKRPHPNSLGIIKALKARGHEVAMIVHSPSSLVQDWGIEIHVVPYLRIGVGQGSRSCNNSYAIPHPLKLWTALCRLAPHVVILKKLRLPNRITGAMAKLMGARLIALTDEQIQNDGQRTLARLARKVLDPRRQVYTAGDGQVGAVSAGQNDSHISVLLPYPVEPVGVSKPRFSRVTNDQVRILMVGSMSSARKRHEWLSRAVAGAGLHDRVAVTYIGTGKEDSVQVTSIRSTEQELGLPASSIYLNMPHQDVMSSYSQYDLFAMPARDEPFGAVVAEALAHGLPVICSSSCGARSCIVNGVNGLVFESDSFEDFRDSLAYLVRNPTVLSEMKQQARLFAERYLDVTGWGREFDRALTRRIK